MRASCLLIGAALAGCSFQPDANGGGGGGGGGGGIDAPAGIDGTGPLDTRGDGGGGGGGHDSGPAPIQFIQVVDNTEHTSPIPLTLAPKSVPGDLLVVMVGWVNNNPILSVTDDGNNQYTPADVLASHTNYNQTVFYACNANAAHTVTATFVVGDFGNQDYDVRVAEYSGIQATMCLDASAVMTGNGTALDSGSLTTASDNELLLATDFVGSTTSAQDPSYTERGAPTVFGDIVEDKLAATAGSYDAQATQTLISGGTDNWIMTLLAFKGL